MKKRKREKLDSKREEKRREWERIHRLQETERVHILLDCHFNLEEYIVQMEDGTLMIRLRDAVDGLSCEKCSHFGMECKGKGLTGESVMGCLREERHRDCDVGMICDDDWEEFGDENCFEES